LDEELYLTLPPETLQKILDSINILEQTHYSIYLIFEQINETSSEYSQEILDTLKDELVLLENEIQELKNKLITVS
jgi:hypothetical protein